MSPHAVDEGASEKRIVGTRHPVHEGMAWIFFGRELGFGAIGIFRFGRLAGQRILLAGRGRGGGVIRRRFTETLAAQSGEETGQPVIALLSPALVGMMMTAGALQSHAKKHL